MLKEGFNNIKSYYINGDEAKLNKKGIGAWFYKNRIPVSLFLITFIVYVIYSLFVDSPWVTDEYITMNEGFYLWGADCQRELLLSTNAAYYGYGYAVIYGFMRLFTSDLLFIYKTVLVFNAVLMGFIPVMGYKIANKYIGIESIKAAAAALVLTFAASAICYSQSVLNDVMLRFVLWLCIYLFFYIYNESENLSFIKNALLFACLGFFAMYAYTVHGRGIVILGITAFFVLIYVITHKKIKNIVYFVIFLAIMLVMYKINGIVKDGIMDGLFGSQASEMGNTPERVLSYSVSLVLHPQNIPSILIGFLGQLYYVFCATFGLAGVAVVIFIKELVKIKKVKTMEKADKNFWIFVMMSFLLALGTLVLSTVFFSNIYVTDSVYRAEYYMYGRYNELCAALLVFNVIIYFIKNGFSKNVRTVSTVMLICVFAAALLLVAPRIIASAKGFSYTAVISYYPFSLLGITQETSFINFVVPVGIFFAVFAAIMHFWKKGSIKKIILLIVCLGIFSSVFSTAAYMSQRSNVDYTKELKKVEEAVGDDVTVYMLGSPTIKHSVSIAFPNSDIKYLNVNSNGYAEFNDLDERGIFIAFSNWHLENQFNDVECTEIDFDEDKKIYCWVYDDLTKEKLEEAGYSFKEDSQVYDVFYARDLFSTDLSYIPTEETKSMTISGENMQYGPYAKLIAGDYKVIITGENLDNGKYDACYNLGDKFLKTYDLNVEPQRVEYYISTENEITRVELRTRIKKDADKDSTLKIEKIEIIKCDGEEKIDFDKAYTLNSEIREYSVNGNAFMFKGANYYQNGKCIKGHEEVSMNPGGEFSVGGLYFNPGKYKLTFVGENVGEVNFSIEYDKGKYISFENVITNEEGNMEAEITVDEYIVNAVLTGENKTESKICSFKSISIENLNNRSNVYTRDDL